MEKKVQRNFLWIALLVLGTIWILARHNQVTPYQTDNGLIFGTVYKVTYQCDQNLKAEIEAELKRFDGSLSPFNDTATITRINRNEDIVPDTFFTNVFCKFPTFGAEFTIIGFRSTGTQNRGIIYTDEHTVISLDKVVERTSQTIIQESEIQSEVVAVNCFPSTLVRSHTVNPQRCMM